MMKANQRFRIRKDLKSWVVYFEMEGPLEMPELSAKIIEQLSLEKTRDDLVAFVKDNYPEANAESEVDGVINTLKGFSLLSL
jgi:hypothetical protein